MLTGGTGAIGQAIARRLAATPGYEVVLLARHEGRAKRVVAALQQATANPRIRFELVDVSLRGPIDALAERWQEPVHVLINNAAVTPRARCETQEGIETQFATNVLGYFRLTQALTPHLVRSAPARVVNVASYWAGGLDLDDLEFKRRKYHNDAAYRQSKQANRMTTVAFAERLTIRGVSVNACHPGDVNSVLSNNLGFGGHETPEQGAKTPAWLATSDVGGVAAGRYFERQREVICPFVRDREATEALYAACESY